MNIAERNLFLTGALELAPEPMPFWYASGGFGPYYINTHYLYGGKEQAEEFLRFIDQTLHEKDSFLLLATEKVLAHFETDRMYRESVEFAASMIRGMVPDGVGFISGGERRDWFFSLILAEILEIPHIAIYKDRSSVITKRGKVQETTSLECGTVLHVADLVTVASSFTSAWIPAIESKKGSMTHALALVDRNQGGAGILNGHGISTAFCAVFGPDLFREALGEGLISPVQYAMILQYLDHPKTYMTEFMKSNPEFLEKSIQQGGKTAERAMKYKSASDE